MNFLVCSDGMPAADDATRMGGVLATACHADVTLLGIAERPADEEPLREAVETQAGLLRKDGIGVQVRIGWGDPIREILRETSTGQYDLTVIGSRRRRTTGLYWRSQKTYEVIKAIPTPVLVAIGDCTQLKRFLVCTGGREFIAGALELTGKLAAAAGAAVTLLHVMAEPPAIYADLVQLEENVESLFKSKSELALNLQRQKEILERLGVSTEIRIRHGEVVDQVFAEVREGNLDLIVTGSSQGRGLVRHYIMGNVTRSILNRANCPILVVRSDAKQTKKGLPGMLARIFGTPAR